MKDVQLIPILLLLAVGSINFSLGQNTFDNTGKIIHLLIYVLCKESFDFLIPRKRTLMQ